MLLQNLKAFFILALSIACAASVSAYAQEQNSESAQDTAEEATEEAAESTTQTISADGAKTLSGISIIGNKDAPKSLYIVPWGGSELELETDLNSSLLNEGFHAVDKDVFLRELSFFESTAESVNSTRADSTSAESTSAESTSDQ